VNASQNRTELRPLEAANKPYLLFELKSLLPTGGLFMEQWLGWILCACVLGFQLVIFFFLKPFLTSYGEEKGKRIAANEAIDDLVKEVQKVTKATETIKADIEGGLWLQQWRLGQKRDSYVRLVDAIENLQVQRGMQRRASSDTLADAKQRAEAAILEFRRARALARLMLTPGVVNTIGPLLRQLPDPNSSTKEEYDKGHRIIEDARDATVNFAKQELHLENP
jgi:hypothetical protein